MFIFPHGIHVDRQGNVWVTDAQGTPAGVVPPTRARGTPSSSSNPDGELLLTLGRPGVGGDGSGPAAERAERRAPSRRTATSSSPRATAARARGASWDTVAPHRQVRPPGATSSSRGAASARRPGSSARRTAWRWTRAARLFVADRGERADPDLRPGRQLHRPVEAVQPPERNLHSMRTTTSTAPTPSRAPRPTRAGAAASASGAR